MNGHEEPPKADSTWPSVDDSAQRGRTEVTTWRARRRTTREQLVSAATLLFGFFLWYQGNRVWWLGVAIAFAIVMMQLSFVVGRLRRRPDDRPDALVDDAESPAGPPATTLLLRAGRTRTMATGDILGELLAAMLVTALLVLVVCDLADGSGQGLSTAVVVVIAVVVYGSSVAAGFLLLLQLTRVSVTIDRERLSVTYGMLPAVVVPRSSVGSVRVGTRWISVRDRRGEPLCQIPLRPKRDEMLTAMCRHDWPSSHER